MQKKNNNNKKCGQVAVARRRKDRRMRAYGRKKKKKDHHSKANAMRENDCSTEQAGWQPRTGCADQTENNSCVLNPAAAVRSQTAANPESTSVEAFSADADITRRTSTEYPLCLRRVISSGDVYPRGVLFFQKKCSLFFSA